MGFTREKIKDFYLLTTDVENIFINEYMSGAPGDYVKVYLYGLLYSQNQTDITLKQMSIQLGMSEKEIDEAWDYWASMGIVEKKTSGLNKYDVEFKQLRALMYGMNSAGGSTGGSSSSAGISTGSISAASGQAKVQSVETSATKEEKSPLVNEELKFLIQSIEHVMGKPLSPQEAKEIFSWTRDFGATMDVILCAVEYCVEKNKKGINYISKVVKQWTEDGLCTEADVVKHLDKIEQRFGTYKKILGALGLNRGATEAERQMIDSWFDKMNFNMDRVMEACIRGSFISSPNIKYVNKILENWYEEAKIDGRNVNNKLSISQTDLNKYYEYLRKQAEEEAEMRRAEVYTKLPGIKEADDELLELGMKLSRSLLGGNQSDIEQIKGRIQFLEEERAVMMTENNYREDYTDIKYSCEKCNDTGITEEGGRCSCTKQRMGEAEIWINSNK